jgi:hypothetical protein
MENEIDFEFRQQPLEGRAIENRADRLALHFLREVGVERREVKRDDGTGAVGGELIDEAVADFATGSGNQNGGFSHAADNLF